MTAEEPLIDLFIQPAKHPYFVKEKSFWTVDRATSLTQRSRSCAQHSRSYACQLPSVGRSQPGDKLVDNGSLPARIFSVSSDGVCAAKVSPQAVVAADDQSCFSGRLSTPVVQVQQAAERRSPWPQCHRGPPFSDGSQPSVAHETHAANGEEGKESMRGAKVGVEPRAAVIAAAVTAASASSPEAVRAATAASTSGSNNLAFLTESIRRKKNTRWHPHSPDDGKDSIRLLSGRGSPLAAADDTSVAGATRGAFYNPGYDAWPDEDAIAAGRSPPFADVECATEALENGTGCAAADARHETAAFAFRRPSTSSVETTGASVARDTVSLSGSSCHEDDIQPLSLVLHVAEEPYAISSDADGISPSGGGSAGVGLPSLTRRLFARHKRDGSARSGGSGSSCGRTGGGPSRYHRDSGRSAATAASAGGGAPSRPKLSASKSSRDAAGCGADRIAVRCCDGGTGGDVAAIVAPSATTSISAASCWPTPLPQSLSPSFVHPSCSARTTLLRSRSRSPSSYSCNSSRLLSDRTVADSAATTAAASAVAATPPRNPSYGSIDSFAYGAQPTLFAGASLSWQRQQHQAESSFFDVVMSEPATVGAISSNMHTYPSIGRPAGSTVDSSGASAARQSIVLRHLEQFDFEEGCDDDFRGDGGSRAIGARKTERRRRQRRVLIAVSLVLALTLTVGAVAAYLIMSGSQSSRGSSQVYFSDSSTAPIEYTILTTSPPNQVRYVGTILLKIDYTSAMADLTSQTARNLTSHFCDTVKSMYSEHNSTNMVYDNCEVTKLERGSVKVTFKVTFTSKSSNGTLSDNTTSSRLRLVLEEEIRTSKFGLFPCDANNFSMELELSESVHSQLPTSLPHLADDDVRLDRMVSASNRSTAIGLTATPNMGVSSDRDEIEDIDKLGVERIGVDDDDRSAATTTNEAFDTHPSVSRYFLTDDHEETALPLVETTNVQRLFEDDATMRRRFDLTRFDLYDSTTVDAASSPVTVAATDATRAMLLLHSQPPMTGADHTTSAMTASDPSAAATMSDQSASVTSGPSAAVTQAGFGATAATASATITRATLELPDVTEQRGSWLSTEATAVVAETLTVEATTKEREEASSTGHVQTQPHSSGVSLAATFAVSVAAGEAAMESEPYELSTSDSSSSATVATGWQLSIHSASSAIVLPTTIAPVVFSRIPPPEAARMTGTPEPTSHDAVWADAVTAAAASMVPVLTITSATSIEHPRPASELLPESQLTSLATDHIYEHTSTLEHVTSVTSLGSSNDASVSTNPVHSTSMYVPQTDSEPDHTGHDAVAAVSPRPVQHVTSTTVPLQPSDDASTPLFGTSMRSTFAEPIQANGFVTAGMSEMPAADTATPFSEVVSRFTSSSALLDAVGVSIRAKNVTSVALQTGTTSVLTVSPVRPEVVSSLPPEVVTSPHTSEPRPRPDIGTSTAAALFDLETSVLASRQPTHGPYVSIAEELMATTSSILTSLPSAASGGSTTLLNRVTAGTVPGAPASQAASSHSANAAASLTKMFSISGDQPSARTNGSDSAAVPLPTAERVATTAGAAFTSDESTALPAFGGSSSTAVATSGTAISDTTNRYSVGCGVNDSYVRPSSFDCRIYELCLHGHILNQTCAAGLYFEPLRNICSACNVSRCNKCPISRMERAGDSGTARAVAAVLTEPEKGGIGTLATASDVTSGRSWAAVQLMTTPTLSAHNVVVVRTVAGETLDRHTVATTSTPSSFVTIESTAERRSLESATGVAHQLQTTAVRASPCSSQGMTADPDDCTAMLYCMRGGSFIRHTCADTQMFSAHESKCVMCNITICSKCVPST